LSSVVIDDLGWKSGSGSMDAELFRCASQPKLSFLPSSIVQVIAPSGSSLSIEETWWQQETSREVVQCISADTRRYIFELSCQHRTRLLE